MIRRLTLILSLLIITPAHGTDTTCPRIISQSPYITHTLEWMGLGPCIVGVGRYDKRDLPKTGGIFDPDGTAIEALEPDLLITSNWTDATVLDEVTPQGSTALRLDGFASMDQITENIWAIGRAVHLSNSDQLAERFSRQWQTLAQAIDGRQQSVLLLTACSGIPYSYGEGSWLHHLFSEAGYTVAEPMRLRAIKPGEEIESLPALVGRFQPDRLFLFSRADNKHCRLLLHQQPVKITPLDGDLFLHPAPILLEGLRQLQTAES